MSDTEENFLESGSYEQPEVESSEPETEAIEEVLENALGSDSESEESSEESEELAADSEDSVQAETEEELEVEVAEALEDGASVEEVKDMIREFQLKVNGRDYTRKIDLNDHDAVQKVLQMGLAGQQAMQKNADMTKAWDQDITRLKNDTASVLKELDIDPLEFSAKIIKEHLAQNEKSEEQIAAEAKAKEYEDLKAEVSRLKKEKEDATRSEEMAKMEKEIETDILGVLEGDNDLPNSPEVIAMVADNMLWAMQNGWDDVTAKDVLPTVKKELQEKFRTLAGSLKSTTALKALLGEDILTNLREDRVNQVNKQVKTVKSIKQVSKPKEESENNAKKVSLKDFMGM